MTVLRGRGIGAFSTISTLTDQPNQIGAPFSRGAFLDLIEPIPNLVSLDVSIAVSLLMF